MSPISLAVAPCGVIRLTPGEALASGEKICGGERPADHGMLAAHLSRLGLGSCERPAAPKAARPQVGPILAIQQKGNRRVVGEVGTSMIDLVKIGSHMPRARHQNGWVEETGKKPKTWTGYYYVYEGSKRLQRSKVLGLKSKMTKGQAEDELRRIIREGEHPAEPQPGPIITTPKIVMFSQACDQYIRLKSGDWCERNKRVMESLLKLHVRPFLGDLPVSEIKPTTVKEWINRRAETQSKTIVQKCLTHARAIFQQLIEDDLIAKDPTRNQKMPKTRKPGERYLELWECRALLNAAIGRDRMILRLFFSCALRPSEVFALRLDDVFPGRLRIDEGAAVPDEGIKDTKTEEADAFVPLPQDLEQELLAYIARAGITETRELLFPSAAGTPMDHKNFLRRHLKPIAERAKVQNVTHQVLRRTVATHFQKHGSVKSTQGLMRHTNPTTTLKHYQKTMDAAVAIAAESWDAELSGSVIQ